MPLRPSAQTAPPARRPRRPALARAALITALLVAWLLPVQPAPARAASPRSAAERGAQRVAEAEAVALALARAQNRWSAQPRGPRCSAAKDAEALLEVARARALLEALPPRLARAAEAPAPETPELERRLRALRAAAANAAALQAEHIEPWAKGCAARLHPAPGLGPPEPGVVTERSASGAPVELIAIIALQGMICPGALPAQGGALVVPPEVCVQAPEPCGCVARPVQPGEVLGWSAR
jgi:hypothetical protein